MLLDLVSLIFKYTILYCIINHSHPATHQILRICSFYNWKFASFAPHCCFHSPPCQNLNKTPGLHHSLPCFYEISLFSSLGPQYLSFIFGLISLSTMLSRFIHIVGNGRASFFLTAEYYSFVCTYHLFFLHSSTEGHFGCSHI